MRGDLQGGQQQPPSACTHLPHVALSFAYENFRSHRATRHNQFHSSACNDVLDAPRFDPIPIWTSVIATHQLHPMEPRRCRSTTDCRPPGQRNVGPMYETRTCQAAACRTGLVTLSGDSIYGKGGMGCKACHGPVEPISWTEQLALQTAEGKSPPPKALMTKLRASSFCRSYEICCFSDLRDGS